MERAERGMERLTEMIDRQIKKWSARRLVDEEIKKALRKIGEELER